MKKIYFDPKNPGSFGGVRNLANEAKVDKATAREWLSQQDAYTLHFPIRHKFKRRKTLAYGVNELWQMDLVDMQKYAKENRGFRYILTIIDVMSRFLRAVPVKNKTAGAIVDALKTVLKRAKPKNIQTDDGTEFFNAKMRSLFKKHNIHHYSTKSGQKVAVLERAHRTLRTRMQRYFTKKNSHRYTNVLSDLVDSYNKTPHSAHGMKPADITVKDEPELYKRLYNQTQISKFRFKVGDLVRISKAQRLFRKGYLAGWTEEVFKITTRYPTNPQTYIISDLRGREIDGRFYAQELQKIAEPEFWAIEKILKTTGKGPSRRVFVKWVGFDDSFNSWIRPGWIQ